jgi:hypothetical protein
MNGVRYLDAKHLNSDNLVTLLTRNFSDLRDITQAMRNIERLRNSYKSQTKIYNALQLEFIKLRNLQTNVCELLGLCVGEAGQLKIVILCNHSPFLKPAFFEFIEEYRIIGDKSKEKDKSKNKDNSTIRGSLSSRRRSPSPDSRNSRYRSPSPDPRSSRYRSPSPDPRSSRYRSPSPDSRNSRYRSPSPDSRNSRYRSLLPDPSISSNKSIEHSRKRYASYSDDNPISKRRCYREKSDNEIQEDQIVERDISESHISDPVIPDPVIPDPVISDPVISDPVISDPVISDPVISDPVISDPVISERVHKLICEAIFSTLDETKMLFVSEEANA